MAKFLPLLLLVLLLVQPPPGFGASEIIEQFKRNRSIEEDKPVIDAASRAEVNAVDEEGRSALFYSRHMGTTLLLLAGADPNLRGKDGRTPAFRAVSRSPDPAFPIMLDLLTLAHADVNVRDGAGFTLLAWAVHEDNLPAVRLLLLLGANPAPEDVPGNQTPLFLAQAQSDDKMADALRRAIGGKEASAGVPSQELADAARAARLAAVSDALAAGADVNARDKDGATALYRAVADQRANVAALLLLSGANPNLAKNDGRTPLMECAKHFEMDSERMLMDLIVAGADVNATAKDGTTALSQAVASRNNTAAQWMIWRGASLDVKTPDGTLMQIAALHPDWPSMIALLKKAGLPEQPPLVAGEKSFVLFTAVKAGDLAAVEAELNKGTPANISGKYDRTALEWAICYDQPEIIALLMKRGADINHQHSYNGEHLIHTFAGTKGERTADAAAKIQRCIDLGANPNLLMHDGCTPLMVAAREGGAGPSLDLLLRVTRDLNARNKQGLTALGLARQNGHAALARTLEAHGAME